MEFSQMGHRTRRGVENARQLGAGEGGKEGRGGRGGKEGGRKDGATHRMDSLPRKKRTPMVMAVQPPTSSAEWGMDHWRRV